MKKIKPTTSETHRGKPQLSLPEAASPTTATPPARREIEGLAYSMYINDGRPDGRDVQHWLEAEKRLLKSHPAN